MAWRHCPLRPERHAPTLKRPAKLMDEGCASAIGFYCDVCSADTWPQALAIQASPTHVGTMLKQRAQLVDDIWHACGDTATDYNWYTKRGLLAAVYAATELFMITDYSPGYADTWQSLDRRLADVKRFGSAATEVGAIQHCDP